MRIFALSFRIWLLYSRHNCYYEKTGSEVKNITDEIPFDIPDTWIWSRISECYDIRNGFTPLRTDESFWNNGTIPWFTVEDIRSQGKEILETKQYITKKAITADRIVPANSFLLCCTASIGTYAQTRIELTTNQQFNALTVKDLYRNLLSDNYLFGIGDYFSNLLHVAAGKTTFEFVSVKKLGSFLIPIPPKAEQGRIVAEIEKFEPLIAEYDKLEQQATKLDGEIYEKLKKSILQYAIQGKLVQQDSNDEPASVLLERIRAEKKAQLGKKYVESYIYKGDDNCYYEKVGKNGPVLLENLPFDIPDSWCWARLENAADINPRNNIDDNLDVSFVEMKSIMDGFNNAFCYEKRKWRNVKSGFTHFKNGDVGFAKITPCFQNRKFVVFHGLENCYGAGTTELHILRAYSDTIFSAYLLYFVKSPYFIEHGKINFSGTAGQQRFGTQMQ